MQEQGTNLRNFVAQGENDEALPSEETPQARASRGESFSMQFTAETADGDKRRFEAIGRPLRHDNRQGGVVVIRMVAR